MKIKNSFSILLCSIALVTILASCGTTSTTIVSVNFGVQAKGGGACSGKGICTAIVPSQANNASAIPVTFITNSLDKNLLIMTFSMSELKHKQPDQVQNFTDGGSYTFDSSYSLSDVLYMPLKLQANPHLDATCQSKVAIKGDQVVVTYTYAHK